jgi:hypothetical protein
MALRIDLRIVFYESTYMSHVIADVPCVPPPGSHIQTENGRAYIMDATYDFNSPRGSTVVTLTVTIS